MQTITAPLLAEAQKLSHIPVATLTIKNTRPRWATLHDTGSAALLPVDACCPESQPLRVKAAGGKLYFQRVTTPATEANWTTWTEIAADASANDCAICANPDDADNLRVFYLRAGPKISYKVSTDGGENWSAAADAVTGYTNYPSIAADGIYLVASEADTIIHSKPWGSGAWGAVSTYPHTAPASTNRGVAVAHDSGDDVLYLAHTLHGWMCGVSYDCVATTWSPNYPFDPAAQAAPPADSFPSWPSAAIVGTQLFVAWQQYHTGTQASWAQPVVVRAVSFAARGTHFGDHVALDMDHTTLDRPALCYDATNRWLYASSETHALRTLIYGAADDSQNLGPLDVYEYHLDAPYMEPASLVVVLVDPDGDYKNMGVAGETAEPIQPLAEVHLARGYVTADGDETIELWPLFITATRYSTGQRAGLLTLICTDAWGLLDLWHPTRAKEYYTIALDWLAAECLAQVGLSWSDDGDTSFDAEFPVITILPQVEYTSQGPTLASIVARRNARNPDPTFVTEYFQTGRTVINDLLNLSGGIARCTATGLDAFNVHAYAPSDKPQIGNQSEIIFAQHGESHPSVTTAFGSSRDYGAHEENTQASMALGLRLPWTSDEERLATQAIATEICLRRLALSNIYAVTDTVIIGTRPDLELADVVRIYSDTDLIASATERHLLHIIEDYHGPRAECRQTLTLGAT